MKEIVARATIKFNNCFNSGFVHIKNNVLEGAFTLDYVKIHIINNSMDLLMIENVFSYEDNNLKNYLKISSYQTPYPYETFNFFDEYILSDVDGSTLSLTIESLLDTVPEQLEILSLIGYIKQIVSN